MPYESGAGSGRRDGRGGRAVIAVAAVLAVAGGALFVAGCPSRTAGLWPDILVFACLLVALAGALRLVFAAAGAPRRDGPGPGRAVPYRDSGATPDTSRDGTEARAASTTSRT